MKKTLSVIVFMVAALAWAAAQQSGSMPDRSSGQTTAPSSQIPSANPGTANPNSQVPNANPSTANPNGAQPGAQPAVGQGQIANAPITQGCLGGTSPNFTITDTAGTTYKLNIPPDANTSAIAPHVGEPVQVMGEINAAGGSSSIDVTKIGRGTGKCPAR